MTPPSLAAAGADVAREMCRLARDDADRAAHHAVRRAVFVAEQGLFADTDVDDHDAEPETLHVVAFAGALPAGAVRLYPLAPGVWKGDRLAVLPEHRTGRLGATLVRFAVATAAAHGGSRMVALIQQPNELFFRRLGWSRSEEPRDYLGLSHVPMEIGLR